MARNKLSDLNNHLFAQLERLEDEEMTTEELKNETDRAKAISIIANNIINNASLAIKGAEFARDFQDSENKIPEQFQKNIDK